MMGDLIAAIIGLIDAVVRGVSLGNMMWDDEFTTSYIAIAGNTNEAYWNDLINGKEQTLNPGQTALAAVAQATGMEFINDLGSGKEFKPQDFVSVLRAAAEGMEALSQSIDECASIISHNVNRAAVGVAKFATDTEEALV